MATLGRAIRQQQADDAREAFDDGRAIVERLARRAAAVAPEVLEAQARLTAAAGGGFEGILAGLEALEAAHVRALERARGLELVELVELAGCDEREAVALGREFRARRRRGGRR